MAKRLLLYTAFHLNLAYSSIEEEDYPQVLERCYWPLLRLAREYNLPFGIEATGYTLEAAAAQDPAWLDELRHLTVDGPGEFIGSGHAQVIGPLVPPEVNAANLRLGHTTYERLLGHRPQVALVNEQAYSAGLVSHYLDAGYRAIIMEWDNPASCHPEWNAEWRYLPQIAVGQSGCEISLIWNKSIAFQKFQRYAHGDMELDEYLDYLGRHLGDQPRAFPLYGNDVEIFDFRPGRYHTESPLVREESEWARLSRLFERLLADGRFQFVRPGKVLELNQQPGAGNRLHLESPDQPVPVKKQGKYNLTRWAVTGRDDLGINTACWRIYEALRANPAASDDDWRELCFLWSSDFRTHITEKRWAACQERLARFAARVGAVEGVRKACVFRGAVPHPSSPCSHPTRVDQCGRYLVVETDALVLKLNTRRGLAFDGLWFKGVSDHPLIGTLPHGYYDDITLGADFYTGHLVLEAPGQPKVTDLNPVEPMIENSSLWTDITGVVQTPLGAVSKRVRLFLEAPLLDLEYRLDWKATPPGSLRLGHVTLNPAAFERSTLFYRTHNGGCEWEQFNLTGGRGFDHGKSVSFLVSASQGLGLTAGAVELGDRRQSLRVEVDKAAAALIGLITYRPVGATFFYRLSLSAREIDETRRGTQPDEEENSVYRLRIAAGSCRSIQRII
ncbi:MAG: glycoside hydrolase family 57 [bacterium]